MQNFVLPFVMLALAACAEAPDADRDADHGPAVEACAAVVAAHVGKPIEMVAATWAGASTEGRGMVSVTDAGGAGRERRHTCEVDGSGRVLAIRHPEA